MRKFNFTAPSNDLTSFNNLFNFKCLKNYAIRHFIKFSISSDSFTIEMNDGNKLTKVNTTNWPTIENLRPDKQRYIKKHRIWVDHSFFLWIHIYLEKQKEYGSLKTDKNLMIKNSFDLTTHHKKTKYINVTPWWFYQICDT